MKKSTYLLGVASGLVLASSWKFLAKEGIKAGVLAGRQVKKISDQVMEDLEDARAEAFDELKADELKAQEQKAGR
jgi:hypothetical protein